MLESLKNGSSQLLSCRPLQCHSWVFQPASPDGRIGHYQNSSLETSALQPCLSILAGIHSETAVLYSQFRDIPSPLA